MLKNPLICCFIFISGFIFCQENQETYYEKDLSFINPKDKNIIAGTYLAPDSSRTFPLVILISGSGPQNRNSNIGKHALHKIVAEHLVRDGFASFRYDDRGVGESTGIIFARLNDELSDVHTIIDSISVLPNTKFSHIGLFGHSLGGMIGTIIGAEREMDFLVLMASPFERGDLMMIKQKKALEALTDLTDDEKKQSIEQITKIYDFYHKNKMNDSIQTIMAQYILSIDIDSSLTSGDPEKADALSFQVTQTLIADILNFNPDDYKDDIACPTLFVYGAKDYQVVPFQSIENIKAHNQTSDNDFDYVLFGGLNHLMQKCESCTTLEYVLLDQAIEPEVLHYISAWMKKVIAEK